MSKTSMIQPKTLPQILGQACNDGISTSLLLNTNGSIYCSCGSIKQDKLIGAIVSNIWNSYVKSGRRNKEQVLKGLIIENEVGCLCIEPVTKNVLVCLCGDSEGMLNVDIGKLKMKTKALVDYLKEPFSAIMAEIDEEKEAEKLVD